MIDSTRRAVKGCACYPRPGPPVGRTVSVVDALGAPADHRPYRAAMTHSAAVAQLGRCAGTQLDPSVVAAVVRLVGDMDLDGAGTTQAAGVAM
jgi:HD-GYP domain-containing protein (c-di-GMP phosphodiesterase class II)